MLLAKDYFSNSNTARGGQKKPDQILNVPRQNWTSKPRRLVFENYRTSEITKGII